MKASWGIALLIGVLAVSFTLRYGGIVDSRSDQSVYTHQEMRMELEMETDAASIQSMEEVVFLLRATRPSGEPISGATVHIRVSMPDMLCGILPGDAVETAPGHYRITVLPVMPGRWQAETQLSWQGNVGSMTASFDAH